MTNYENGKIYQVFPNCEHKEHEIYIGSTTKTYLSQRLQEHKRDFKRYLSKKYSHVSLYKLFNKYETENFNIFLLENFNCEDVNQLKAKEGEYIKNTKCINKKTEGRTRKEYNDTHKEEKHQWYLKNRNEILENHKLKTICSCGCEVTQSHMSRHIKTQRHNNLIKQNEQKEEVI